MTMPTQTTALSFRAEVVDAQTNRWLGPIRLIQPLSSYAVVGCAMLVAAALMLLLGTASFSKKISTSGVLAVAGRVQAGSAPLVAQLWVSAPHIGQLHLGMPVILRFSALPFARDEQLHGVIGKISYVPIYGGAGASVHAVPLYLATVSLPRQVVSSRGGIHVLEPGMVVEATVLRERRVLWRWLFEPLSAYLDYL